MNRHRTQDTDRSYALAAAVRAMGARGIAAGLAPAGPRCAGGTAWHR